MFKRQGRLAHARPGGQDDELAGLEAAGDVVQVDKPRRDPGDADAVSTARLAIRSIALVTTSLSSSVSPWIWSSAMAKTFRSADSSKSPAP